MKQAENQKLHPQQEARKRPVEPAEVLQRMCHAHMQGRCRHGAHPVVDAEQLVSILGLASAPDSTISAALIGPNRTNALEKNILDSLRETAATADELAAGLDYPVNKTLAALTQLEAEGLITVEVGARFRLNH